MLLLLYIVGQAISVNRYRKEMTRLIKFAEILLNEIWSNMSSFKCFRHDESFNVVGI